MIWLAPAGRHTLVKYLAISELLVLSQVALSYRATSTLVSLFNLISAWLTVVTIARFSSVKKWCAPIARWPSVY
jgi:hypothetical protein